MWIVLAMLLWPASVLAQGTAETAAEGAGGVAVAAGAYAMERRRRRHAKSAHVVEREGARFGWSAERMERERRGLHRKHSVRKIQRNGRIL